MNILEYLLSFGVKKMQALFIEASVEIDINIAMQLKKLKNKGPVIQVCN